MKTSLLIPACALLGAAAFAADPDPPAASTVDPKPSAQVSGKATITIDVNGKKETREVDLGNALQITDVGGVTISSKSSAVRRTWLGVVTDEPSDDVRAQLPISDGTGLLVRSVIADSPAAKGGLEKNDVLVRLDDQILTNAEQLGALVRTKKEGDPVHVTYLRKGHEASVEVKLGVTTDGTTLGDADLGAALGKSVAGAIDGVIKPLILKGAVTLNKAGQFLTLQNSADGDKARDKATQQWSLTFDNVPADVSAQMNQLEKTLRDAGLNDAAIAQTEQAVAAAVGEVQKALANAAADKGDIQRNLQKAREQVNRAVEEAVRAAGEAALKAKAAEPATPAPAPVPPKAP